MRAVLRLLSSLYHKPARCGSLDSRRSRGRVAGEPRGFADPAREPAPTPDIEILQAPRVVELSAGDHARSALVYSIRNISHHRGIARALASGKKAAMFGMGIWGIVKAVEDPRGQRRLRAQRGESKVFWEVKIGRQPES